MISLGTHQSALWGYSTADYPADTQITGVTGSYNYNGLFTKPTLAPNGNLYGILITQNVTLNGTVESCVIIKVTPGTSNTGSTNWQSATRSYLKPDATATDANGFARPVWPVNENSSAIRFHTGILAPNGLIYFAPYDRDSLLETTNKWVILNPTTETWKVTDALRPSIYTNIPNSSIGGVALGTDGKIYVAGTQNAPGFRITPSANALSDTVQDSFYASFLGTSSPLGATTMSWIDSTGASYTDTASLDGIVEAYKVHSGGVSLRNFNRIRDMITHPSGKIFIIPGRGRGRIFYINQAGWGTANELLSEPGYSTASISGYGNKTIAGYYAFLEKQRDPSHDPTTLKIYIAPVMGAPEQSLINSVTDLLVLNPVSKTMSALNLNFLNLAGNSQSYNSVSRRISLPNGMTLMINAGTTSYSTRQGGVVLTGWDVPGTDTDGINKINFDNKGVLYRDDITALTVNSLYIKALSDQNPGFTAIGGGVSPGWPHNSKFIGFVGTPSSSVFMQMTEVTSVKGYGPGITNFNFSDRDKLTYQIPASLGNLASSIFNCQFNKMK